MIGYIKGYDICKVTRRKIDKEGFLDELLGIQPAVKEEILQMLENKGLVYGLKKEKALRAVYLFERRTEEDAENAGQKNILVFRAAYRTDDVAEKMEELESAITEELKEKVSIGEYARVEWDDIEINPQTMSGIGFSGNIFALCFCCGVLYGVVFDNLALGTLFGLAIGLCFGSAAATKKSSK